MPETTSSTEPSAPNSRPASSLESLLMRFRLITPDQLDEALREQRETGRDVGAIVVERGWINEDQLARLLSYAPAFPGASEPEPASALTEPEVEQEPETEREPEHETVAAADEAVAVEAEAQHEVDAEAETEPESQPDPESEPELPSAGPVISAEPEPSSAPELPSVDDVPPALELLEPPELSEAWKAENDEAPAAVAEAAEAVEVAEPEPAPLVEHSVELMPITPIVSALEPVVAESEPVAEVEPLAELEPVLEAEPVVEPDAEPVIETEAAPVAEVGPELAVAAEPEPQTVKFVEPPAIETIARVFVRLSNGERVEAGSFDDVSAAKARAEEVVREVSNGSETWPFYGGRYIRPDVVVSVDVDATVVRYA